MGHKNELDPIMKAYTHWVLRWRWPIILATLGLVMWAGSGARFLSFATDYRIFFSKENPQLNAFEAIQNIYTKNDNVLFVLEPKDGNAFSPQTLDAVEYLTQEGWKLPYAIRVDSISNFQHTIANGDDIVVSDLVEDALSKTPEELEEAKKVALLEPFLLNIALNPTASVTAINVTIQQPGESITEVPEIVAYARNLKKEFSNKYPDINVYLTGMVMLNNAFAEASQKDMQSIVPLMYLGMIVLMFLLIRSISGTIATVLVIAFSTITAMGMAGWAGVKLTPPSAVAPTMIMTLAVADSIHILITMLHEMRLGKSKVDAIVESIRINVSPVFMTSFTTVIGFLSMNFSDAPPFRHLGNITAVGVTVAFFYSVLFLPALISVLPIHPGKDKEEKKMQFQGLSNFVIRTQKPILWASTIVVLLLAFFITQNKLNDQFVKYFDKRIQFRNDTDFSMKNLTGIYTVQHSLGAGESSGISNPEYLQKLEEFTAWYKQQPGVLQVNSFSHVMKRLNKSMHGDDESYFKIPDSRELAAQYLLLYEFSLPYGLDLNNQINVDKSATRFTVTLGDLYTDEIRATAERGEQWLKDNAPQYMFAHGVSPAVMFSYISERNIKGMLEGTTIALVLISFCLIFTFRSFKFGLLTMVPNLVPGIVAFGLWGYFVGEVGLAMSVVTGMTLGIVVDDTVHFMNKYLRARREQNLSPADSVRYAFSTVGKALVVTSVILVVGFLILSMSSFKLNGAMGQLTAIVIAIALLADFLMLPALLMSIDDGSKIIKEKEGELKNEFTVTR